MAAPFEDLVELLEEHGAILHPLVIRAARIALGAVPAAGSRALRVAIARVLEETRLLGPEGIRGGPPPATAGSKEPFVLRYTPRRGSVYVSGRITGTIAARILRELAFNAPRASAQLTPVDFLEALVGLSRIFLRLRPLSISYAAYVPSTAAGARAAARVARVEEELCAIDRGVRALCLAPGNVHGELVPDGLKPASARATVRLVAAVLQEAAWNKNPVLTYASAAGGAKFSDAFRDSTISIGALQAGGRPGLATMRDEGRSMVLFPRGLAAWYTLGYITGNLCSGLSAPEFYSCSMFAAISCAIKARAPRELGYPARSATTTLGDVRSTTLCSVEDEGGRVISVRYGSCFSPTRCRPVPLPDPVGLPEGPALSALLRAALVRTGVTPTSFSCPVDMTSLMSTAHVAVGDLPAGALGEPLDGPARRAAIDEYMGEWPATSWPLMHRAYVRGALLRYPRPLSGLLLADILRRLSDRMGSAVVPPGTAVGDLAVEDALSDKTQGVLKATHAVGAHTAGPAEFTARLNNSTRLGRMCVALAAGNTGLAAAALVAAALVGLRLGAVADRVSLFAGALGGGDRDWVQGEVYLAELEGNAGIGLALGSSYLAFQVLVRPATSARLLFSGADLARGLRAVAAKFSCGGLVSKKKVPAAFALTRRGDPIGEELRGYIFVRLLSPPAAGVSRLLRPRVLIEELRSSPVLLRGAASITGARVATRAGVHVVLTEGSALGLLAVTRGVDFAASTISIPRAAGLYGILGERDVFRRVFGEVAGCAGEHVMLFADALSASGRHVGVGYSDLNSTSRSVLRTGMYEKPVPTLSAAALYGLTDPCESHAARMLLGLPLSVGPAVVSVVADLADPSGVGSIQDRAFGSVLRDQGGLDAGGASRPNLVAPTRPVALGLPRVPVVPPPDADAAAADGGDMDDDVLSDAGDGGVRDEVEEEAPEEEGRSPLNDEDVETDGEYCAEDGEYCAEDVDRLFEEM
jgi:hypothetical protein